MASAFSSLWGRRSGEGQADTRTKRAFRRSFSENLRSCAWTPHPQYSVFTQYDQDFYLSNEQAFQHKYRCFFAVSKTISPQAIVELGAAAGSSADAYLSATPTARYVGYDIFGTSKHQADGSVWDPYEIATRLFASRGFSACQLKRANLRKLTCLPEQADMLVVDAAHDFDNEYGDLKLALTASPRFIFVDDADDPNAAKPAIDRFLTTDLHGRIDYTVPIEYAGGGLVIKLKD